MVMEMVVIRILWDDEARVWVAVCDEIGLAIESDSYDDLLSRISVVAPEMANENHVECR